MNAIQKTNEYITFVLQDEEYAIEVSGIESILEYTKITKLPGTDDTVKGVINLRGNALPVIDLRAALNLDESEISQNTSIIVMLIESGKNIVTIGGIVDAVKEVLQITPDMIQEAPKVGIKLKSNYISGIAKHNDRFVIILDIHKVLSEDLLAVVSDENLMLDEDYENLSDNSGLSEVE